MIQECVHSAAHALPSVQTTESSSGKDDPALKEECLRNGQGACKDVCQRVMTFASKISPNIFGFKAKPPSLLGQYETVVTAHATDAAIQEAGQEGGAVTALLIYCN